MTDHWWFTGTEWRLRGRTPLPALVPPVDPPTVDPGLPFELAPLLPAMAASPKLVLPHWFVTFPLGGDGLANSNTWFTDRMPGGSVTASDGDWDLRDRPYDPFARPRSGSGGWSYSVLDKAWEIQQAYAAGITCAVVDWLNLLDGTGDNRTGQIRHLQDGVIAAGLFGKFFIAPMIDGNTSTAQSTNLTTLILKSASLLSHPATLRDPATGDPMLFIYMPEGSVTPGHDATGTQVHDFYASLKGSLLNSYGIDIGRFWAAIQRGPWYGTNANEGLYPFIEDIADPGRWGSRNVAEALNPNAQNAGAIDYMRATFPGRRWLAPVAPQDSRPNQNKFEESQGYANYRAMWQVAIEEGAEGVQIATWSDFAEHAHIMPSRNHGWCWLDITAYYKARYQLGFWPTVTRDTIYGAHRIHATTATPTKTTVPRQVRTGGSAEVDIVEAFCFLRDTVDTTVRITVGGTTTTFTPGPSNKAYGGDGVYSFTVPLRPGSVSMQIVRGGVTVQHVDSPFTVTTTPLVDDFHYRCFSSRRAMDGVPR